MRLSFRLSALAISLATVAGLSVQMFSAAQASEDAATAAAALNQKELDHLLANMPKGDVARGAQLNTQLFCASCHGEKGVSPSQNWPHVAGQTPNYIYKTLLDYQFQRRATDHSSELMVSVAKAMSPQDMADVAAYLGQFKLPTLKDLPGQPRVKTTKGIRVLASQGDADRLITPCASCHGAKGEGGANETPALAGQVPQYFITTMIQYREGRRTNDTSGVMQLFAQNLSDAEIVGLAHYYAQMGKK